MRVEPFRAGVKVLRVALVYQCGIANVFQVNEASGFVGGLYQGGFRTAEALARGAWWAGATLDVMHCDEAGDITHREWKAGKGDLFGDEKHPP